MKIEYRENLHPFVSSWPNWLLLTCKIFLLPFCVLKCALSGAWYGFTRWCEELGYRYEWEDEHTW